MVVTDLGPVGVWTFGLDRLPMSRAQGRDALVHAALLLGGTRRCIVATGIASIYARSPSAMALGGNTVSEAFPGRFLLGLGVSHAPMVEGIHGQGYGPPVATMRTYLDAMDATASFAAQPPEPPERVLAALGPRMLALAGARTRGAHPYLVPPEHTARARATLGPGPLLAPEQMAVLDSDPDRARTTARASLRIYLPGLVNYVTNLRRLGFTDEDLTPRSPTGLSTRSSSGATRTRSGLGCTRTTTPAPITCASRCSPATAPSGSWPTIGGWRRRCCRDGRVSRPSGPGRVW